MIDLNKIFSLAYHFEYLSVKLADGSAEPEKGKFAEQFASLKFQGQTRDNYVVKYVEKFIDNLPLKPMAVKDPVDSTKTFTIELQPQYFSIEGIPVQIGAVAAEKIAQILSKKTGKNYSLPTKEVIQLLHAGNAYIMTFQWSGDRLGVGSEKLLPYSKEMAERLSKLDPDKFVVGVFKEKYLPSQNKNLHSNGLVGPIQESVTIPDGDKKGEKLTILELINKYQTDPSYKEYESFVKEQAKKLKVIQNYQGSTMHDAHYVDYSEGTRFMGNINLPDGRKLGMKELIDKSKSDSSLEPYAKLLTAGKSYSSYL